MESLKNLPNFKSVVVCEDGKLLVAFKNQGFRNEMEFFNFNCAALLDSDDEDIIIEGKQYRITNAQYMDATVLLILKEV